MWTSFLYIFIFYCVVYFSRIKKNRHELNDIIHVFFCCFWNGFFFCGFCKKKTNLLKNLLKILLKLKSFIFGNIKASKTTKIPIIMTLTFECVNWPVAMLSVDLISWGLLTFLFILFVLYENLFNFILKYVCFNSDLFVIVKFIYCWFGWVFNDVIH